jgi:hypothetical protein
VITPRRRLWAAGSLVALLTLISSSGTASAQFPREKSATAAEVVAGNVLIGGFTAATRAIIGGKDPWKAFSVGALGGAVHVGGKYLAVEPGAINGWLGLAVAGTGTSIVSNAGRGVAPLTEMSIPVASARLRITPGERRKLRFVVNGYETALIASAAFTKGLAIDWTRTLSSGAVVFETRGFRLESDGRNALGLAWGPVVLLDPIALDRDRTARHEIVHVHQHWFVAEAWARPLEESLRKRIPGARFVPSWLELGFESAAWYLDERLFGPAGLSKIIEREADRLEKR